MQTRIVNVYQQQIIIKQKNDMKPVYGIYIVTTHCELWGVLDRLDRIPFIIVVFCRSCRWEWNRGLNETHNKTDSELELFPFEYICGLPVIVVHSPV